VDQVIDELNFLDRKYGVGSVVIHDSMFFQNPKWLKEWIEKYPRKTKRWTYWAAGRADTVRQWPDLFEALVRETNWRTISIGFESGSDRMLRLLNKECTEEDNYFAIDLVNRIGDDLLVILPVVHDGLVFASVLKEGPSLVAVDQTRGGRKHIVASTQRPLTARQDCRCGLDRKVARQHSKAPEHTLLVRLNELVESALVARCSTAYCSLTRRATSGSCSVGPMGPQMPTGASAVLCRQASTYSSASAR
jgi:hypothetical protein